MLITNVSLQSADLTAQKSFYHSTLGLPIVEESDEQLIIRAGKSTLTFIYDPEANKNVYHIAFNIPENQLPAAAAWLGARTSILANLNNPTKKVFDFVAWNAHAFYFLDADGNILEFIARHNLPNASEVPFTAQSILNVSEVGFPANDVKQMVNFLNTELELPAWSGAGSDEFTAVGDEEGLLIVVHTNHTWLSAERRATPYPLSITIKDIPNDHTFEDLPYTIKKA